MTVILPLILINSEIVVYEVSSTQVFHKLLVMCNDYKLKVPLLLPGSNDSVEKTKVKCLNVRVAGIAGQIDDIKTYTIGELDKQSENGHGKEQMSSIVRVKLRFNGIQRQTRQNKHNQTYEASWFARLSMLSSSRLVVGSSSVKIPQFRQNVSARANLMISDARTWISKHRLIAGLFSSFKSFSLKLVPCICSVTTFMEII